MQNNGIKAREISVYDHTVYITIQFSMLCIKNLENNNEYIGHVNYYIRNKITLVLYFTYFYTTFLKF